MSPEDLLFYLLVGGLIGGLAALVHHIYRKWPRTHDYSVSGMSGGSASLPPADCGPSLAQIMTEFQFPTDQPRINAYFRGGEYIRPTVQEEGF